MVRISLLLSIACIIFIPNNANSQLPPRLKTVVVGGCVDVSADKFLYCAAVEAECKVAGKIRFKTALELSALGFAECSTDQIPVGTCASTGACAITKDSCVDPDDFVAPAISEGGCNAEGRGQTKEGFVPTQYGACKDGTTGGIVCVLTPGDCTDREAWIPASVAEQEVNGGCRCHDVRVGACKDGSYIDPMLSTCAISVDDCHPLIQSFGTARNVLDHALLDCRLCPYAENLVGAFVTDSPTKSPTRSPVRSPIRSPVRSPAKSPVRSPTKNSNSIPTGSEQGAVMDPDEKSSGLSSPAIALIIVCSLVAFFTIGALVYFVYNRKRGNGGNNGGGDSFSVDQITLGSKNIN